VGLPTNESCIAEAERNGHFRFPLWWKRALLSSNGFAVEANGENWDAFPVMDRSSRKHISRSANHVLQETAVFRDFRGFPTDAVAIAGNGSGDCLIFIEGEDDVYVWDHETGNIVIADVNYQESDSEDFNA
jgi:hypothetical protein